MSKHLVLMVITICIASASSVLAVCQSSPQPTKGETGPLSILYTYYCSASQRPKLRNSLVTLELKRLDAWKQAHRLSEFHIFFSRYPDLDHWDVAILITFSSATEVDHWKEIEARSPSGLTAGTLSMVSKMYTYPLDATRDSGSFLPNENSVFLMIPYDFTPNSNEAYLKYFDGYVLPQIEGWKRDGVLLSSKLYLQRYAVERPWNSLLILQYKNGLSLAARENEMAKVRHELEQDPGWLAISRSKQEMRKEKAAIIADEIR
jgi:hypothetical protein